MKAGFAQVILADTTIWVDHLRRPDSTFENLLDAGNVVTHPFIIGEIALGHLERRDFVLDGFARCPRHSSPPTRKYSTSSINIACSNWASDMSTLIFLRQHGSTSVSAYGQELSVLATPLQLLAVANVDFP
jgi:hypothetical protein